MSRPRAVYGHPATAADPDGYSPPDIAAVAQVLLDTCAAALGDSAPPRRYRSAGLAVPDFGTGDGPACDSQLTVHVAAAVPGQPAQATTGRPQIRPEWFKTYTFTVELVRAVPMIGDSGLPSVEALDASGKQHMADYQTLDRWIRSLGYDSKIDDRLKAVGVAQIAVGAFQTVGPGGGVITLRASVVAAI